MESTDCVHNGRDVPVLRLMALQVFEKIMLQGPFIFSMPLQIFPELFVVAIGKSICRIMYKLSHRIIV